MTEKTLAIIVAGGRGSRLCGDIVLSEADRDIPKQYMLLAGRSVLERTVGKFTGHPQIDSVIVVIHPDDSDAYGELVAPHTKLLAPVTGGPSRQQSVHRGLIAAHKLGFAGKILIHDAARPFITNTVISAVLSKVAAKTGAIAAHRIVDTLKQGNSRLEISKTVPRENLFSAQTPQGFMAQDIMAVHESAQRNGKTDFTDDASMFEAADLPVRIVIASSSNFKITTPGDLARARSLVGNIKEDVMEHADIRTGSGYDVHAFEGGDGVVLCGLKIHFNKKLKGHSDADVALHALTDALLGTIGAGDIGTHFPPCDDQWKDVASHTFLTATLDMVAREGGLINNLDITIICEAPKIGPHRLAMQKHLAGLCGLDIQRVSIKATTNEKLGFLGRGEGIAAIASATVSFGARK